MNKRVYKITSEDGVTTITESLNAFAKEVGINYGQFYTALHSGRRTTKGGYKVEWCSSEKHKPKFKITDPKGIVHEVDSYTQFAESVGVKIHGFKKVLQGRQKQCYGGYTIEVNSDESKEVYPNEKIIKPANTKRNILGSNFIREGQLEVLDIIQEGNTHRIKVKNYKNQVSTRTATFKRVNNINGVKCDFSSYMIPKGDLYAEINMDRLYKLSVAQLTETGYDLKIDFDFNTKVVEKKVEIFTPTLLEETWLLKQEAVIKEIKATQTKLSKLRELKDYIGRNVASVKSVNNDLSKVDDMMNKLF